MRPEAFVSTGLTNSTMPEIETLSDLSIESLQQFDEIIDVRSPAEYAEDHIPGSVNLPVLNDAERAEVGTIYCQTSRHEARRLGARYVTKNISVHLSDHLARKGSKFKPLVYCWRGGMRSTAMATILNSVGWYTKIIESGYRAWRQSVVSDLREGERDYRFILIDGQTGTSKTKILHMLAEDGCQTLDLEALAEHRGSVFGGLAHTKQPSQKLFESLIHYQLTGLDHSKPIFVEAESPKIGRRALPRLVVEAMRRAPRIEVHANLPARARNLVECYADLIEDQERLLKAIGYLKPYHPGETICTWLDMIERKNYESLASDLIESHYDPCYARQRKKRNDLPAKVISLNDLSEQALESAAQEIQRFSQEPSFLNEVAPQVEQAAKPIEGAFSQI